MRKLSLRDTISVWVSVFIFYGNSIWTFLAERFRACMRPVLGPDDELGFKIITIGMWLFYCVLSFYIGFRCI
jgi:hypothetical protein